MFLDNSNLYLVFGIICVIVVIIIVVIIFALAVFAKRRSPDDSLKTNTSFDIKGFKNTLSDFYNSFSGSNNVKSIKNEKETNTILVEVEDIELVSDMDLLRNHGMFKFEKKENLVVLYFLDSTAFYNSLFGK